MADYFLIYDDSCAFCRRAVERVKSLDRHGRITLVPLSQENLPSNLPVPSTEALQQEIHLVGSDGSVRAGSDAVAYVATLFPKSRVIGWLMQAPGIRHLARPVYRWVARNRDRL